MINEWKLKEDQLKSLETKGLELISINYKQSISQAVIENDVKWSTHTKKLLDTIEHLESEKNSFMMQLSAKEEQLKNLMLINEKMKGMINIYVRLKPP